MVWGSTFIILMMLFSSWSWAESNIQKLETDYGKIFIPEYKDWEMGRDMYGMPFIYFSPQENSQRSNISFTYTGVEVLVNLAEMGQDPKGYRELKDNWAKTVDATPLDYHPYKNWKNNHGHIVHEVGFDYSFKNKKYNEKSYYINCRGQLVYAKSLMLTVNKEHAPELLKLVQELDCGAK